MPPYRSAGMLSFPDLRGFTRSLLVWNVGIYFAFLLLHLAAPALEGRLLYFLTLTPALVLHGYVWQLVTYSFLHFGLLGTALELLSIWFLASFLERDRGSRWLAELYFVSVVGAAVTAIAATYATAGPAAAYFGGMTGAFGGVFGMLIAFGVLYGDLQFTLFPLPVAIKARYLVGVYMLLALAQSFGQNRILPLSQLGAALCAYLFIKAMPRHGLTQTTNRRLLDLRNDYYRWKRRNAARKFEVYMKKQNRDVHFDAEGRYVDPDTGRPAREGEPPRDPNDRRWMN